MNKRMVSLNNDGIVQLPIPGVEFSWALINTLSTLDNMGDGWRELFGSFFTTIIITSYLANYYYYYTTIILQLSKL